MSTRTLPLDKAAVCISGLCLLHCLALPIMAAFLPALSAAAEAEWLHKAFVVFAVPISVAAILGSGALPHRARSVFAVAAVTGLILLILGAFVEALHDWEVAITTAGGLLLAGAHLWRWERLRPL